MYEIHTNYGGGLFDKLEDAITAFLLLAPYEGVSVEREEIEISMKNDSFFEISCLSIIGCD